MLFDLAPLFHGYCEVASNNITNNENNIITNSLSFIENPLNLKFTYNEGNTWTNERWADNCFLSLSLPPLFPSLFSRSIFSWRHCLHRFQFCCPNGKSKLKRHTHTHTKHHERCKIWTKTRIIRRLLLLALLQSIYGRYGMQYWIEYQCPWIQWRSNWKLNETTMNVDGNIS